MKRFNVIVMAALLMVATAATAFARPQYPEVCNSPKIASFDILLDYSGSMMMKHKQLDAYKFDLGRKALLRVTEKMPLLGYTGSIHTVATTGEIVPQQTFSREVFAAGLNSLTDTFEVFSRVTPLGDGIAHWSGALYSALPPSSAVILVSDGENNRGIDPLTAAQAAMNANPRLTFHIVSVADTDAGAEVLKSIAAMKADGIYIEANTLIGSDHEVMDFIYDVFCAGNSLVLRSIQFSLGSAAITSSSAAILDEVANYLIRDRNRGDSVRSSRFHNRTQPITVVGHTCSIGSDSSNKALSDRRASAVKAYLVKKGVPSDLISTVGLGESQPKFDNSTEEGRRLNRRAEIDFR